MIKALIASESGFKPSADNGIACGIAQITKQTLKIIQDPNGEVKDFIFTDIRQKDLKKPDIAIPMAVRWLAHKQKMAERRLKRKVTSEEVIMEYKGLTKSKTDYANIAKTKSYYKVLKIDKTRTRSEIEVTPDRIITICEKVNDEIPDLRGFYFLVLDDKNTVISIIRGNTIDKTVCDREIAKINKIIKNGKRIYFGGMHDALDPDIEEGSEHYFKNHGKFKTNGRVLQWMVIANEKGECFATYSADKKPCPADEFPIGKDE